MFLLKTSLRLEVLEHRQSFFLNVLTHRQSVFCFDFILKSSGTPGSLYSDPVIYDFIL
jgi:hypothetical protein